MKKTILNFAIIVSSLSFIMLACKKESQQNVDQFNVVKENPSQKHGFSNGTISGNARVSQYGFLIFDWEDDFEAFKKYVTRSTHGDVQRYLASIGFYSRGAEMYGPEFADRIVSEEQAVDYAFNRYLIFQVRNAIMKPIGETQAEVKWEFLLTMTPENLNPATYENIRLGAYDAHSMDKFATNPAVESLGLFDFIDRTPTGYEETQPNTAQAARPMFGSVTTCTDSECFNPESGDYDPCSWVNTKKYFFWIKVSDGRGAQDGWKYGSCAANGY